MPTFTQPDPYPAAARLLALGDSYTIGAGVDANERWPVLLQQRLLAVGTHLAAPEIIAVTGWTCADLGAAMDSAHLAPPYALASLCIGVNDEYEGVDVNDYRPQFRTLLQRATTLVEDRPERVLVVSIPDWSVTRCARERGRNTAVEAAAIDAYNACAQAETSAAGATWIDVTGISRAHPDELAADGLHPSAAQYRRWLTPIFAAARGAMTPLRNR